MSSKGTRSISLLWLRVLAPETKSTLIARQTHSRAPADFFEAFIG